MALRQAFNITTPPPAAASPVSLWQIKEDTAATYLMAKFSGKAGLSFDGNVGVRLVRTDESVTGFQTVAAVGPATYVPLALKSSYNDALPILNLRVKLTEGTYVHLGASKALTRPDFANMSPSLTLSTVSFNSSLNVGSAGNPNLPPMRSDNYDLAGKIFLQDDIRLPRRLLQDRERFPGHEKRHGNLQRHYLPSKPARGYQRCQDQGLRGR